jgi:DNA-binding NtrC family response regulator
LEHHAFPGNVRELKNIIENAVVMSDTNLIDNFIPFGLRARESILDPGLAGDPGKSLNLPDHLRQVERRVLQRAKQRCNSTREMASVLGISQPSVVRKLNQHKL